MKSKRAQKELEKLEKFYPFSGWIAPSDTYRIAEIAERDAEDRMRKKARFIQKLNENESNQTPR